MKKTLAILLALAMVFSTVTVAFAEGTFSADAQACITLGMLKGKTSAGVTADYLLENPTRIQAAILFLRLKGQEEAALAFTGTDNFADADKAAWAKPVMAYLKANPQLGFNGIGGDKFDPTGKMSANAYYKVILTALGYRQDVDFAWADIVTFAAGKNLTKVANDASFTNDDLAVATIEGLKAVVKGSEKTLATSLVEAGALTAAKAEEAGVYSSAVTLSAKAVAANKLEVTFNKAVDTAKAAFTVKKGTVAINVKSVAWNEAKTVATLTGFTSFAAGTYTVSVAGLDLVAPNNAATIEIAAQKVAGITINGDVAPLTATGATSATVGFKVVDQYGTDVTTTLGATLTPSTTATAAPSLSAATKEITINWTASPAVDSVVVVTLIDPATGVVGTKSLKVGKPSAAASITLGALTNKDAKVLRTNTALATDIFAFDVNAVDQYGNAVDTAAQLGADFIELASDPALTYAWVNATSTAPATLKITGVPATAGTYTITLVSNTTGASTIATVVVEKAIGLDSFAISMPVETLYVGEYVEIPYAAADQYGTAIDKHATLAGVPTITVSDTDYTVAWVKNAVDGTAKLRLTAGAGALTTDNVVVTAIYNGKVSTFTIKPLAAAAATRISAISADTVKNMTVGGTVTLTADDVVIRDQYEREMDLPAGWSLDVATSDAAKVSVATTTLTGVATGSSTITVKLHNGTAAIATSAFEFVANTVAKSSVVSYVIDVPSKVFVPATAYATASAEEKAYAVDIEVYGKTAAGDKVALKAADIISLNSTNTKVDLTSVAGKLYANGTLAASVDEESATLVGVINGANGVETVTNTITLTDAAKAGTAIVAKAIAADVVSFENGIAVMTATNVDAMVGKLVSSHAQYNATDDRASVYFEVKDQYGVASAAVKPVYYTISAVNAAGTAVAAGTYTINATTGAITASTATTGDVITITGILSNGTVATVKVVVQ